MVESLGRGLTEVDRASRTKETGIERSEAQYTAVVWTRSRIARHEEDARRRRALIPANEVDVKGRSLSRNDVLSRRATAELPHVNAGQGRPAAPGGFCASQSRSRKLYCSRGATELGFGKAQAGVGAAFPLVSGSGARQPDDRRESSPARRFRTVASRATYTT